VSSIVAEPFDRLHLLPDGAGISMTRVFDAPRDDVWKEWTEPERFSDWFGHPGANVPLDTVSMDVRVGGAWRMTMFHGPSRRRIDWRGDYLEVDPPARLVFTVTDQPDGDRFDQVIVDLVDLGDDRTEMRFEQRGGGLSRDQYLRAGRGWSGFFDRIEARLARA
jgi:uncharacterized protein YndB with AHSA1/START domain